MADPDAPSAVPVDVVLTKLLSGRSVTHTHYATDFPRRCAGIVLHLDDGTDLTVSAQLAANQVAQVGGPRIVLRYTLTPPGRRRHVLTDPIPIGEGSQVDQDLQRFAVGKTISTLERGAMTAEGYAANLLHFEGQAGLLLIARPMPPEIANQTGILLTVLCLFLERGQPPGLRVTPGQALLN